MEFDENDLAPEISIRELYESEKKEEKRKAVNEKMKEYNSRPGTKERKSAQRDAKIVAERLKKMDQDQHIICKKLGKSIAHSRRNPEYRFKCKRCEVSFSEKQKSQFYLENRCPCCHFMLRQRKTVTQKRNLV